MAKWTNGRSPRASSRTAPRAAAATATSLAVEALRTSSRGVRSGVVARSLQWAGRLNRADHFDVSFRVRWRRGRLDGLNAELE